MISVTNLSYSGIVNPKALEPLYERIDNFSCSFSYRKIVLLEGNLGDGGWALSWILGGVLRPIMGNFQKDGKECSWQDLQKETWCVPKGKTHRFTLLKRTVKSEIRHGLSRRNNLYFQSEEELVESFLLTPERYNRSLSQLSEEVWRASCAIGMANNRRIFCFPHLSLDELVDPHRSWFISMLIKLRDFGCLVLLPSDVRSVTLGFWDDVIPVAQSDTHNPVDAL